MAKEESAKDPQNLTAKVPEPELLQNLTAKRLKIFGNDSRVLVLAPFEKERELLSAVQLAFFPQLDRLEMQNFIRRTHKKVAEDFLTRFSPLIQGTAYVVGALTIAASIVFSPDRGEKSVYPVRTRWVLLSGAIIFVISIAIEALVLFLSRRRKSEGELVQSATRGMAQAFTLLLILTLGIGLPLLAFYFFAGGRDLLSSQTSIAKLGRALQLVFIFTASLLPALLYFLFDRQQLGTLRQKFEQQIFRLDPNIKSLRDVWAKYGRQIDEIYGPETASGEGRLVRGTRWPILVATLVITLGWMLTLLPSGGGLGAIQADKLIDFFLPQKTAVTFGFLGAYFFVLNTVLHRYVRADLKPKAYSSIAVRIFVVIILAWVVGLIFEEHLNYQLMIAFMFGIFPESGLTLIRESIRSQTGLGIIVRPFIPRTQEKYPLTELEELDVYDRARLLDEGVTNIESLAHHDLIDLMLETRIPVPRLVDWVDQAILYLHLQFDPGGKKRADLTGADELRKLRDWLRGKCVRTASDFKLAYDNGNGMLMGEALKEGRAEQLQVLFDTLKDDEWLDYIDHWRNSSEVEEETPDASSNGKQLKSQSDLERT